MDALGTCWRTFSGRIVVGWFVGWLVLFARLSPAQSLGASVTPFHQPPPSYSLSSFLPLPSPAPTFPRLLAMLTQCTTVFTTVTASVTYCPNLADTLRLCQDRDRDKWGEHWLRIMYGTVDQLPVGHCHDALAPWSFLRYAHFPRNLGVISAHKVRCSTDRTKTCRNKLQHPERRGIVGVLVAFGRMTAALPAAPGAGACACCALQCVSLRCRTFMLVAAKVTVFPLEASHHGLVPHTFPYVADHYESNCYTQQPNLESPAVLMLVPAPAALECRGPEVDCSP